MRTHDHQLRKLLLYPNWAKNVKNIHNWWKRDLNPWHLDYDSNVLTNWTIPS
uniref:ORF51 n=1 Tax=Berkeleya fennica TaxID=1577906 RepID=A0A0U1XY53_BERFE|nr:ORF51 [Berkeleya fennica]AJA05793.1 ORF51 [Berkeleya fennica]